MTNDLRFARREGKHYEMTGGQAHTAHKRMILLSALLIVFCGCGGNVKPASGNTVPPKNNEQVTTKPKDTAKTTSASQPPFTGKEIPILCYHQIRDWKPTDSKFQRVFITPVATFKEQMKALHDSGYEAVLPDQLMAYMQKGGKLPPKPVMLTFDDGPETQYETALPELDKYGYKAVFYIMTVVLGHKDYMTSDQVKKLSEQGHVIGCHTWNHQMVTKLKTEKDWHTQIEKPKADLEKITGLPVKYFAYPYGVWNVAAVGNVKKYGFIAAFQLYGKMDQDDPYFTIKRIIANPDWNGKQLLNNIRRYQK